MALFEVKNLHKRFGDQVVLENINLSFEENKLHGIMGPNGAGKTTCFNVLTGRYKPSRGKVVFAGEEITGLPERIIAQKGISRSFQIMNIFDEYTVLENIVVALPKLRQRSFNMFRNVTQDQDLLDEAYHILKQVGLDEKASHQAESLPYGDRRALEIAIALACKPRMLFLDEPTSGLGMDATLQLIDLIGSLKDKLTLVIIEHDMPFLFRLADEISVIHWGQVIAHGTPTQLKNNKWVQASNLGQFE